MLDICHLLVRVFQIVDVLLNIAAPLAKHAIGFPEPIGRFRHRHTKDRECSLGPELNGDETCLLRAGSNERRTVAVPDKIHALFMTQLNSSVRH